MLCKAVRIYCGPVAPYGPTVYRCFFGDLLRIYCGSDAPHRPTVYMRFFAEPQNPTGPQCISRIDLRARRRSAVDPQTNTCETVVPQDLTGRQWIRKIQQACSKSAKSIYGRARSRSSVDPRTNTCKTVDPQDPTGPQSIRKIQRACCRSAVCPRRTVYLPFPVCTMQSRCSGIPLWHSNIRNYSNNLQAWFNQPESSFGRSADPHRILSGPFETNNKRRFSPNYNMMQRNEILFWRQSIACDSINSYF